MGTVDIQGVARLFLPVVFQFRGAPKQAEAMHRENIAMLADGRERERYGLPVFPSHPDCWDSITAQGRFQGALQEAEEFGDRATTAHSHLGLGKLKGKLGLHEAPTVQRSGEQGLCRSQPPRRTLAACR
jgi:hypothetical protein